MALQKPPTSTADRELAARFGARLRAARQRAGLTQAALADGRYTKAYVSALEHGHIRPSMAALAFLAGRLGVSPTTLLGGDDERERSWARLEADVHLASGDWQRAADGYRDLLDGGLDGAPRAESLVGLAEALYRLDRGREAINLAAEAATRFADAGRWADAALATYWQAAGLYHAEASAEARVLLEDLERRIREGLVVAPDFEPRVLVLLAMVESRDDRPGPALGYLESARARLAELDDRRRATFLFSLAITYRELGDLEAAIRAGTESLAVFRAAEARFESASLENELALVHLALGNLERARSHVEAATATFDQLGDRRWLAHTTETLAQIELAAGDPDRAHAAADEAVAIARETGNQKALVSSLLSAARSARLLGDPEAAEQALDEAATICRSLDRRSQLRDVLAEWSDAAAARGDLERALRLAREAVEATRTPGAHETPAAANPGS